MEEGRTVSEWTYAAERAPRGLERMVVSFGFLVGGRFAPDVVRAVALYPKPRVFSLRTITTGWGTPDAIGTEEATGRPSFQYRALGLLIILDKTGVVGRVPAVRPPPGRRGDLSRPGSRPPTWRGRRVPGRVWRVGEAGRSAGAA